MTDITVCFASRGRPESLAGTVGTLIELAAEPHELEILVAIDPDDEATKGAWSQYGTLERVGQRIAPERYGYNRLHEYLNQLAKQARGTWCMWWNDDFVMQTRNWDQVIREHPRPAILWPRANHVQHGSICPIWPKAWSDAWGHASPIQHMDTYLQYVGEALGRHDRIGVEILHDRADLTGNHDDATYAEGRKLLGSEGMVPGFDPAAVRAQVVADVLTLEREGLL